jgi:16S rRNA (uracil1498-N3)-methyltransferase
VGVRAPIRGLAAGEQELDEEASRYLVRVLRLASGARFVGFDPDAQTEADVTIVDADAHNARVSIAAIRQAAVTERTPLVLIYALAKGDKVDDVVRDATELGATRIIVTRTERSVVKAEADKAKSKIDRWKRIVVEAARQCGRSDPPQVDGIYGWPDALDRAALECERRFCLDPRAVQPIGEALPTKEDDGSPSIAFAIGPEGGLSSDEIEIAMTKGFLPVHMGRFVLRTETVAAAILGAVRILRKD